MSTMKFCREWYAFFGRNLNCFRPLLVSLELFDVAFCFVVYRCGRFDVFAYVIPEPQNT